MPPARLPEQALDDLARAWQRERRRVLRDPGPEAVHRLRTATRRLETAAAIATDRLGVTAAVPWSDWHGLRAKLSRLRDLDVTMTTLRETEPRTATEAEALRRCLRDLGQERRRARRRAVAALDRHRVGRVPRALKGSAAPPAPASERLTAARAWWAEVAGPLAREPAWGLSLVEALRGKAGREAVHAIRIRVRELRYGLEWWDRLGQVASAPVVAWLRDAQDTLGRLRDYDRASKALSGPELRRSRTVVGIRGAAEIAHWPSVASQGDLLGSSPFEGSPP